MNHPPLVDKPNKPRKTRLVLLIALLSLLLIAGGVFAVLYFGKLGPFKPNEPATNCEQALALIEAGEPKKAHELLAGLSARTEEEEALLQKLVFLPTKITVENFDKTKTRTILFTYDENGRLLTAENYAPNGALTKRLYLYDQSSGQVTEETFYPNGYNPTCYLLYDENGRLQTKKCYADQKWDATYTYTYNEQGLLSNCQEERPIDRESTTSYAYKFDAKGNVLTQKEVKTTGESTDTSYFLTTFSLTYDDYGRLAARRIRPDGKTNQICTYSYDENKNVSTERREFPQDSYFYTITYTYSDSCVYYPNGAPENIRRTIDELPLAPIVPTEDNDLALSHKVGSSS